MRIYNVSHQALINMIITRSADLYSKQTDDGDYDDINKNHIVNSIYNSVKHELGIKDFFLTKKELKQITKYVY